jgi:hypothetical protein
MRASEERNLKPVCYSVPHELTSPRWCAAFAAGCGGTVWKYAPLRAGPVALFGSACIWKLLKAAIDEKRDWYYGDHAYFGRNEYYRCTRNGWQHDGRGEADPERFQKFGLDIRDWRTNGNHVLICPPDEKFAALLGFPAQEWLQSVVRELKRYTDRPLRIRERADTACVPLTRDLDGAWALVTHMSNAAVEAVLEGIPVFCTGTCAALTMGTNDLSLIENPVMSAGRLQWASVLAANQWTLDEMRRGDLWRYIGD